MNRRNLLSLVPATLLTVLVSWKARSRRVKPLDFPQVEPYLSKIPDREADLIRLYYAHKRSVAEIAQTFGVPKEAVAYRLSRGRQRLRDLRC